MSVAPYESVERQPDAPAPMPAHRWLREPARPRRVAAARSAPWLAVGTVCVGAFMGQLDASIASLAVPAIRRDLASPLVLTQWVALTYLLTLVALVAPVGRWSDAVGRKLVYLCGFAVFTVGSAACGLAPTLWVLLAARVVQAFGAAMLQANSVALIRTTMSSRQLPTALGVQGTAQALGLALGPGVGGLLLAAGSWRLLFLVNVPAGALGLLGGWFLLPRSRHTRPAGRLDVVGLALLVPGIVAALLALSVSAQHLARGVAVGVVAMGLLVAFAARQRTARNPLLDRVLLAARDFRRYLAAALTSYSLLFAVLFAVPLYLQEHLGMSAVTTGLVLSVLPAGIALAAPFAGLIARTLGQGAASTGGMGFAVAGSAVLLAAPSGAVVAVALALLGLGMGLFTPANNALVMASAPVEHAGGASGLLNMTRGVGTALGVAAATLAFTAGPGGGHGDGLRAVSALLVVVAAATAVLARGGLGRGPV